MCYSLSKTWEKCEKGFLPPCHMTWDLEWVSFLRLDKPSYSFLSLDQPATFYPFYFQWCQISLKVPLLWSFSLCLGYITGFWRHIRSLLNVPASILSWSAGSSIIPFMFHGKLTSRIITFHFTALSPFLDISLFLLSIVIKGHRFIIRRQSRNTTTHSAVYVWMNRYEVTHGPWIMREGMWLVTIWYTSAIYIVFFFFLMKITCS